MNRVKAANSVAFANRDIAPVSGTPQYFTAGNPVGPVPATTLPGYFLNMIQDEFLAVITTAGLTPDDANWAQLLAAMRVLFSKTLAVRSLSAGAYVPTPGTASVEVEVIGGSGGGGGTPATGAGQSAAGGGGGSGARCRGYFTSGFSGAIVTIGAGGASVSGAAGGNAGTSSFGALLSAPGGLGGGLTLNPAPPWASLGGAGGAIAVGGYWNEAGAPGANGINIAATGVVSGGGGGNGGGAPQFFNAAGVAGLGHGGGGGAAAGASQAALAGGAGSAGQVIVREFS